MRYISSLLICTAIFCGIAKAGTMGELCSTEEVVVPCNLTGWDFGIKALYLEPAYSSDFYLTTLISASNQIHYNAFEPKWSWGFMMEGSYHFGTGNDVHVEWFHHEKVSDQYQLAGIAPAVQSIQLEAKHKWDAVNGEFGQLVQFGKKQVIRFHGGLQYARLGNRINLATINLTDSETIDLKFNGAGPRTGIDLVYRWNYAFSTYAKGAAALLAGSNDFRVRTLGFLDVRGYSSGSRLVIVPEMEGKIGAAYLYSYDSGDLFIDVGYMWQNYFNPYTLYTTNAALNRSSDFGIRGAYFGIKYIGYT